MCVDWIHDNVCCPFFQDGKSIEKRLSACLVLISEMPFQSSLHVVRSYIIYMSVPFDIVKVAGKPDIPQSIAFYSHEGNVDGCYLAICGFDDGQCNCSYLLDND